MVSKMLSWRCSNRALSLSLLLVSSMSLFSMEEKSSKERFFGSSIEEIEQVFQDAPPLAKKIVAHLKNPNFLKEDSFGYAFLVGEPGTGKSTLAKAIAYKTGWKLAFYAASAFVKKDRNAASEHLIEVLNKTIAEDVETLFVIDELNKLLENYENKNYDTDTTSATLWTFLDAQEGNRKFFFIGTMNRAHKLPPQVKSRILASCIQVYPPKDSESRKRIFLSKLLSQGVKLSDDGKEYINDNMKYLTGYTGRDFKKFALVAKFWATEDNNAEVLVITKKHLEGAANHIKSIKEYIKFGESEETDEMRQERYHRENIELQNQIFMQQQILNRDLFSESDDEVDAKIISHELAHFTPEQLHYYEKIKQNRKSFRQQYEKELNLQRKKQVEDEKKENEKKESGCGLM